jgi:hypothetical protein
MNSGLDAYIWFVVPQQQFAYKGRFEWLCGVGTLTNLVVFSLTTCMQHYTLFFPLTDQGSRLHVL